MKKLFLFISCFLLVLTNTHSQAKNSNSLIKILGANKEAAVLNKVLGNPTEYRVQIIYTEINRNKKNKPRFTNYYFNYDPELYFNPASMVKLPIALLALEKLQSLQAYGVDIHSTMFFDSAYERQVALYTDSTAESGKPSIAHFIRKIFLISDNDAYNRLYQFVGQEAIHASLFEKGYTSILIPRQFMGFTEEQNKRNNPVKFIDANGTVIYEQPMQVNTIEYNYPREVKLGKGFMRGGKLVEEPFDFSRQNYMSLEDMQLMLQSVLFPLSVPESRRFNISEEHRQFLLQYMSQYASETNYPKYNAEKFFDSYAKFFFRPQPMPEQLRVFNKTGWAYGFLTDVSYVADFKNNIEYMLSATVYVNSDGILNDGKYDYNDIGYPFLYELGQAIYEHEKKRKRKKANLQEFKLQYETRNPSDKRPVITDVDN